MKIYESIIVGAGLGGIAAAVNLQKQGISDFRIIERADGPGGTWRSNTYPGCGCDTQMIAYQFSFALNPDWDSLYPKAPQILKYVEDVVSSHGLAKHCDFETSVEALEWLDDESVWRLDTSAGAVFARTVFSALGQFHTPSVPALPGLESFTGAAFHSGAWDHGVDLTGKRVAVVGSAASAVQLIPEVAAVASQLKVFQRTPNWVIPRGDRIVGESERRLLRALPDAVAVNREFALANADALIWPIFEPRPEAREFFTSMALGHLEAQIADEDLRSRLTPTYPIGCKRLLLSDDFYPTLALEHVELVDQGVGEVVAGGLITADGASHEVDVIVWATGFEATGWEEHVPVRGVGGTELAESWRDEPRTLLGVAAAEFPNLYFGYGPNTNLGHGPVTYMLERQAEFYARILAEMQERGWTRASVRPDEVELHHKALHTSLRGSTWADPSCASYYKSGDGVVTKNWMGSMGEYRQRLEDVSLDSFFGS